MSRWSSGQDVALSRRNQGFDSPTGYHTYFTAVIDKEVFIIKRYRLILFVICIIVIVALSVSECNKKDDVVAEPNQNIQVAPVDLDVIINDVVEEEEPKELTNEERYALELDIPEQFTQDDLRMLTTMVFKESGLITNQVLVVNDENPDGIYMPADVIHEYTAQVCLNHLNDDRLPDTIYDDLSPPRYSKSYRSEQLAQECKDKYPEQWARVEKSCLLAMNGYVDMPANVIYQSNYPDLGDGYFASIYVDTGWFRSWTYFAYG